MWHQVKTLQDFDRLMTCPLWGYKSLHEYYKEASGMRYLAEIKIPFLVCNSLDDPIVTKVVANSLSPVYL